jgi:hypothetical protein
MRGWKGIGGGLLFIGFLMAVKSGLDPGGGHTWFLLGLILILLGVF